MSLRRILALSLVAVLAALTWSGVRPAGAVDNPDYTAPPPTTPITTPPPTTEIERAPEEAVVTAVAVQPLRTRLAITGSSTAATVVVGASLVAAGAALLAVRRRHADALSA